MNFAIVVGRKAIIKAIFPRAIDGGLLKLVHLSNSFRMLPNAEPLKDDLVFFETLDECCSQPGLGKDVRGLSNYLEGWVADYGGHFTILVQGHLHRI